VPLDGPVVDTHPLTLRLPKGWHERPRLPGEANVGVRIAKDDMSAHLQVFLFPQFFGDDYGLKEAVKLAKENLRKYPGAKITEEAPVDVKGRRMYHLVTTARQPARGEVYLESYGGSYRDIEYHVDLTFEWSARRSTETPEEREAITASILDSITWKPVDWSTPAN